MTVDDRHLHGRDGAGQRPTLTNDDNYRLRAAVIEDPEELLREGSLVRRNNRALGPDVQRNLKSFEFGSH
jgi:hypothetical protein